jgi:hypothetical protein
VIVTKKAVPSSSKKSGGSFCQKTNEVKPILKKNKKQVDEEGEVMNQPQ